MYATLLETHSVLRFFVLILLIFVVVKSFNGLTSKKSFGKTDDMLSLTLFSITHTHFLIGIVLYLVSPKVQFSGAAMKDPTLRYWTSEHGVIMLAAIVLITLGRITLKKMTDDTAKHRRVFIYNMIALVIILVGIGMAQRGFFSMSNPSA